MECVICSNSIQYRYWECDKKCLIKDEYFEFPEPLFIYFLWSNWSTSIGIMLVNNIPLDIAKQNQLIETMSLLVAYKEFSKRYD